MSEDKYLEEIEKTYQTICANFDKIFAQCETDEEKDNLISARNGAKNAFWIAVQGNLAENNDAIEKAHQALLDANQKMIDSIDKLEDVNTAINTMEEAIRLAAAVAAMAT